METCLFFLAQTNGEAPTLWLAIVFILGGLFFLTVGGESLVSGAARLALRLRLTPTVIGLTVVAAGTSLPELVVSIIAQFKGSAELALGNVVGSNIFNIGMVLGLLAMFRALPIPGSTAKLEFPALIAATVGVLWLGQGTPDSDGLFTRVEGIGMLIALIIFISVTIRVARNHVTAEERAAFEKEVEDTSGVDTVPQIPLAWTLAQVILGAIGLWIGGKWLIEGSIDVARLFDVSERVIGLTIVAGGTGAPELVASLVAIRRGKGDMAVGNVIGSNLFNLLAILGIAACVKPLPAPATIVERDFYWLLGITLLLIPFFFRSNPRIRKIEGGLLFATYIIYIVILLIQR